MCKLLKSLQSSRVHEFTPIGGLTRELAPQGGALVLSAKRLAKLTKTNFWAAGFGSGKPNGASKQLGPACVSHKQKIFRKEMHDIF